MATRAVAIYETLVPLTHDAPVDCAIDAAIVAARGGMAVVRRPSWLGGDQWEAPGKIKVAETI